MAINSSLSSVMQASAKVITYDPGVLDPTQQLMETDIISSPKIVNRPMYRGSVSSQLAQKGSGLHKDVLEPVVELVQIDVSSVPLKENRLMFRGGGSLHPGTKGPGVRSDFLKQRAEQHMLEKLTKLTRTSKDRIRHYKHAVWMSSANIKSEFVSNYIRLVWAKYADELKHGGFLSIGRILFYSQLQEASANANISVMSAWDEATMILYEADLSEDTDEEEWR